MTTHVCLFASVFLLGLLTHLNSLGGSFHYDDAHSIVENAHLRSLANIPAFFRDPATFSNEASMAMYRPVVQASYALTYAWSGYTAWPFLLFNVIIHALVSVLVFALVEQKTQRPLNAWWAAAVFAVHPLNSQITNYISSRSEGLAVLGVFAALYCAGQGFAVRSAASYAFGLLSKSVAIICGPVMWLWHGGTLRRRIWVPITLLTGVYLAIIVANQFLTRSFAQDVRPFGTQIYTQTKALVYYIYLIAAPIRLSVEHPLHESYTPMEGPVWLAGLLLVSLLFFAWRGRGSAAALGTGVFYLGFAIPLVVPLNIIVNEHRAYLAFLGLVYAVAGSIRSGRRALNYAAWGMLSVYVLLTWQRNDVWLDDYSLWSDAAEKAPQSFRAQSNLGLAQYERGELQTAQKTLQLAVTLNPSYAKTWSNLGLVHEELRAYGPAEDAYARALLLRPGLVGARANLGRLYLGMGRYGDAIGQLATALESNPHSVVARTNLGLAHQRAGRLSLAVQEYERALLDGPLTAQAFNNLGLAYQDLGRMDQAEQALQQALKLPGRHPEAAINLQILQLRRTGRDALEIYQELTRKFPDRLALWRGLAEQHAARGQYAEAIAACRHILALDPSDGQALANLEKLLKNKLQK